MKFAKRLSAFLLVSLLILSCVGCGSKEQSLTVSEGKLTMATNAHFPPYEYYEGDKIIGIDAEVAGKIAEKLGLELEIADIEFDSIVPGVQTNKYDMGMAGMTVTDERKKKVNFSTSYAKGVQVVIVPEDSDIKSLDDLKGKIIGVQQSTTGDIYISDEFGEENTLKYPNGNIAVEALKNQKVACVVIDNEPAKAFVAKNEGLKILDTPYDEEDYAICFSKDNEELQKKVNDALEELIADGTLQSIVDKYIKSE